VARKGGTVMNYYQDKASEMLVTARVNAENNKLDAAKVYNEIAKTYVKLQKIENHERAYRNPIRTEGS